MNTQDLIQQSKARFSHQASRDYLKEKYQSKLLVATQNGLWRADPTTISFLSALLDSEVVAIDTFEKPLKVDRLALLKVLTDRYSEVSKEYLAEWKKAEDSR